jgi:mono/diheme cytochrome c family protein
MIRRAPGGLALAVALIALAGCKPVGDRSTTTLWRAYCARCHGRDGAGAVEAEGVREGLDLTVSRRVALGDRAAIAEHIVVGKGRMPAFGHRLSPAELDRLVDFVLTLAAERPAAAANRE